jgi:hypothetical protein
LLGILVVRKSDQGKVFDLPKKLWRKMLVFSHLLPAEK